MSNIFVVYNWFFGYDIVLEALFAIITLIVSFYAYKLYKISAQRTFKHFAFAFFAIAISYIVQTVMNLLILFQYNDDVTALLSLRDVYLLNLFAVYISMLFFIIGLITLFYTTLNYHNYRLWGLMFALSIVAILFSINKLFMFYLVSSILLIFIVIHYLLNYAHHKHIHGLLMFLATLFLLFSSIHFILAVNHGMFYVIGHILELFAYLLVLTNLALVFKHGKKKR